MGGCFDFATPLRYPYLIEDEAMEAILGISAVKLGEGKTSIFQLRYWLSILAN